MTIVIDSKIEKAIKAINKLHEMIDWDKLKIAEEKAFSELKKAYPDFIKSCNLLEYDKTTNSEWLEAKKQFIGDVKASKKLMIKY